MDPLSLAAGVLGIISEANQIINGILGLTKLEQLKGHPRLEAQLRRFTLQIMLFRSITSEISQTLSEDADGSLAWILDSINEKLKAVSDNLAQQTEHAVGKPSTKQRIKQLRYNGLEGLEQGIDEIAQDVRLLCDLYHTSTLHEVREQLRNMQSLSQDAARYALQSSELAFDRINNSLTTLHSEFSAVFHFPVNPEEEDVNFKQRRESLELVRQRLQEGLGRLNRPSLVFPFNLVPQGSDASELPTRMVKLDTGAHDNWISSSILDRWGVRYESENDSKIYVGAGGGRFRALGRVTLFWYSTNKAKTRENVFLVHDALPFDAILGSESILTEPMDTFAEGVFPLMHIIPRDELETLRETMATKGIDQGGIKRIQRAQKARIREENRQSKAASRMTTRTGTPGLATPNESLFITAIPHSSTSTYRTTSLSHKSLSETTSRESEASTPPAYADPRVEHLGLQLATTTATIQR